tara:strand:- start:244 stop:435 length:192 start_codon:yes stop_codon:yes gene_type:complete
LIYNLVVSWLCPKICDHLQSAFYDSNKKKFLAAEISSLIWAIISSPKEKPPQLNSCEGLGFGL